MTTIKKPKPRKPRAKKAQKEAPPVEAQKEAPPAEPEPEPPNPLLTCPIEEIGPDDMAEAMLLAARDAAATGDQSRFTALVTRKVTGAVTAAVAKASRGPVWTHTSVVAVKCQVGPKTDNTWAVGLLHPLAGKKTPSLTVTGFECDGCLDEDTSVQDKGSKEPDKLIALPHKFSSPSAAARAAKGIKAADGGLHWLDAETGEQIRFAHRTGGPTSVDKRPAAYDKKYNSLNKTLNKLNELAGPIGEPERVLVTVKELQSLRKLRDEAEVADAMEE